MRRPLVTSVFVASLLMPMTAANAGDAEVMRVFGWGRQVVETMAREQARAEAAERRREAAERRAARTEELRRTKAGRRQLARERDEAEATRRRNDAAAARVVDTLFGGRSGRSSSDDHDYQGTGMSKAQYQDGAADAARRRNCDAGMGC